MDGPGLSIQLYDAKSLQPVIRTASAFSSGLSSILSAEMLSSNAPSGGDDSVAWTGRVFVDRALKPRGCQDPRCLSWGLQYDMLMEYFVQGFRI